MGRRQSKKKKINPHFWVFCEGKTEEEYIAYLRQKYRVASIEIISKVSGSKISEKFINNYKKGKFTHNKDIDFLVYDSDVPDILKRLKSIDSVRLITSNPSIELWFLLHYKSQKASVTTDKCITELCNRNRNEYKKGVIDKILKEKLDSKCNEAIGRAKELTEFENPSSNMYKFIEILEEVKNKAD